MAFCGQCGLLLPPNVTTCPRCGMAVTPVGGSEGQHADDATIVSESLEKTQESIYPHGPKPDLVQEPDQFAGYYNQTQGVKQGEHTPTPSVGQNTPFPRYYTQDPLPPPGYISHSGREFLTTQEGSNPGPVFPTGPGTLPPSIPLQKTRSGGNLWVTLLILFLLGITVGITAVVAVIGPTRVLQVVSGSGMTPQPTSIAPTPQVPTPTPIPPTPQGPTPTPVPPTPNLTPEQQAQAVIDRYYAAINNKDYQTAYNLWVNYPTSEQDFANGFANTKHDDHQFGQVILQNDGTVQAYITLIATSTRDQQTTYQGYYIVGQQSDGSWKIMTASLNKA